MGKKKGRKNRSTATTAVASNAQPNRLDLKNGKKRSRREAIQSTSKAEPAAKKGKRNLIDSKEPVLADNLVNADQEDITEATTPSSDIDSDLASNDDEDEDSEEGCEAEVEEKELSFDFEAMPPAEGDLEGIVNLLAQIFLRQKADVDCEGMAKRIVEQSPLGCVFIPTELEEGSEGGKGVVSQEGVEEADFLYGVVSIVGLGKEESYYESLTNYLLDKAKKHGDKKIRLQLESTLKAAVNSDVGGSGESGKNRPTEKSAEVGFVINERLLHFPARIAGPAFTSLIFDLDEANRNYAHVVMVVKVRIADPDSNNGASPSTSQPMQKHKKVQKKKRLGKAAKKRLLTAASERDVIFDNPEEAILFKPAHPISTHHSSGVQVSPQASYFQFAVQSDVEKDSEFHSSLVGGRLYKAYRRVVLLGMEEFKKFAEKVAESYST